MSPSDRKHPDNVIAEKSNLSNWGSPYRSRFENTL